MSQEFYDLDANNNLNLEIPKMNKSIKAAASDFAGKAFPAAPFVGMTCYREDLNISYKYNGTAWMVENDYNRSPYVVTVAFTANDERWTELIEGESYALTIPRETSLPLPV